MNQPDAPLFERRFDVTVDIGRASLQGSAIRITDVDGDLEFLSLLDAEVLVDDLRLAIDWVRGLTARPDDEEPF